MPELKKNDEITLDITDLNNLGCGVGRYEGAVVFVRGAVSGDRIICRIIKVNKNYYVGKLIKLLRASEHRIYDGVCPAPESCGGCVYRHISYDYELELKRQTVENAFRRAGLFDVHINPVRSTGVTDGYRNKAMFPVAKAADGRLRAGLYASKTHELSGGSDCRLQPGIFGRIADRVCALAASRGVRAYDEERREGLLRHIYLRRAGVDGSVMLCLVINGDSFPDADGFCREIRADFPEIRGILLNINKKDTNVVLGDGFVTLWGEPYIEDELCGLRFRIAPNSFYQVNREGAEILYRLAGESAGENKNGTLLDLYCGAGTIGLTMAERFGRVVGIEIVPEAVVCARENAKLNKIENAYFTCGDASDAEGLLGRAESELGGRIDADTVIIDPPRKGTTPELIKYISDRGIRRVVYVSCDPATLARDCAIFREYGYLIGDVNPVDMFPRTGHVETVVLMSKAL